MPSRTSATLLRRGCAASLWLAAALPAFAAGPASSGGATVAHGSQPANALGEASGTTLRETTLKTALRETTGRGDEVLPLTWDRRAVEHVWNRAGFGIHQDDIDRWVEAGPEALVNHLLAPRPLIGPAGQVQETVPSFEFKPTRVDLLDFEQRTLEERREFRRVAVKENATAFRGFRSRWVEQIAAGDDPLRDWMCLFWHGIFTSSYITIRHPSPMIEQHDKLRSGALGSYDALLRAMMRDVALLKYLDGDKNRKGRPNENLAREVMELFSLGEGNYTEQDIAEAARALTGAGVASRFDGGHYRFYPKRHDDGEKTILGVTGHHTPDDLPDILLAQPACARFIASSIIEYLEGLSPSDERVERYAGSLRATDYDVGFMLRRLLLDPEFYRDEVIGARVSSPVDYLMGNSIRLGDQPPAAFVVQAAAELGEDLFQPPNVKGWEAGLHWMSTARFMLRGNVAGASLGRISREGLRSDAQTFVDEMSATESMAAMGQEEAMAMGATQLRRDELTRLVQVLERGEFQPSVSLVRAIRSDGALTDGAIVDSLASRLLAIEPPPETLRMLEGRLVALRAEHDIEAKRLSQSRSVAEPILRELAHQILSLPEAQLH